MTVTTMPKRPHHATGEFFNPQTEYLFLSYHIISSPTWVRCPFLKLSELKDVLEGLPLLFTPGMDPASNSKLPALISDYERLQVYNESWLSELHQDWNESLKVHVDSEYTNRQIIFGNLYERSAVNFTGVPSLSRQEGEEQDAWRDRVDRHRAALKQHRIERMELHTELSDLQSDLPSLFALRY